MQSQAVAPADEAAATLIAALAAAQPVVDGALTRARAFAEPLLAGALLDTGEDVLAHADGVAAILAGMGASPTMQAAAYLVYTCDHLNKPQEAIAKGFGEGLAALALETTKLVRLQRMARIAQNAASHAPQAQTQAAQTESVRKMLLAFSRDLRVVMLRLASRLQTLRHFAASKLPVPPGLALESLNVFAPLANRLGIWQVKWALEDLAFRFLEPQTYHDVAKQLDEKRAEREAAVERLRADLAAELAAQGIAAQVQGRPKTSTASSKKCAARACALSGSTTSARCASSSPTWRPATPR